MDGPLIVIAVSALASWRGCTETGAIVGDATAPDDYDDRACAVDDLAGVIAVGDSGAQALVLADESATSCYLPEHRAFLRWLAADSEDGLKAAAQAVLADPATEWEEYGTWMSDGPAVLMDSAEAGAELRLRRQREHDHDHRVQAAALRLVCVASDKRGHVRRARLCRWAMPSIAWW
ncbi:Imm21 family immunity protein [Streptomyces sp. NPDC059744]|uniref:Imm21 family immunity protein n=1 Tax=Streptomyces sp. NPDC059744 TaxID=3346929 RepID=UPI0036474BC9